jgi:hypothetical protein
MTIALFSDPAFAPLPDYTAADLRRLLRQNGLAFTDVDHRGIERLRRADADVLVLPYVRGDFSEKALVSLLSFHAAGGSLLFLGDLPHRDRWYPLRNMHASRFRLTRCYD